MRFIIMSFCALVACGAASSQMTVDSHTLFHSWRFSDDDEDFQETIDFTDPVGYDVARLSTLSHSPIPGIDWSATLDQRYTSETFSNGFRNTGRAELTSDGLFGFYTQRHVISLIVDFSLSERTMVRVHGSIMHDPELDPQNPGGVFLLNGTEFFVEAGDVVVGASTAFEPAESFDTLVEFDAGDHRLVLQSFSTGLGQPDNGLLGVNTAWDITVEVVPTPASGLAMTLGALLALRRQR